MYNAEVVTDPVREYVSEGVREDLGYRNAPNLDVIFIIHYVKPILSLLFVPRHRICNTDACRLTGKHFARKVRNRFCDQY